MSNTGPRLTTRGIRTAEHIAAAKPFTTSGNLRGEFNTARYPSPGWLNEIEMTMLNDDAQSVGVNYIVWSFGTPIAWRRRDGRWRIVAQSFSPTTSKHQGNLYKIEREEHDTFTTPITPWLKTPDGFLRHRAECGTCATVLVLTATIDAAREFAHGHRFNYDHPIYQAGGVSA